MFKRSDVSTPVSWVLVGAVVVGMMTYARRESPQISKSHWTRSVGNLIGHRGCRTDTTPTGNTMSAFRAAAKDSVVGIELDLQITSDNKVVVYHDLTTGGNLDGPDEVVMKMTYEELSSKRFLNENDSKERIPLFEEVVKFAVENNLKLIVELKGWSRSMELCKRSVEILKQYQMMDNSMIISFNPFHIYDIRTLDARIPSALLVTHGFVSHFASRVPLLSYITPPLDYLCRWMSMEPFFVSSILGATSIGPGEDLITSDWVKRVHSYNMSVDTWTVNTQERVTELRNFGVNLITTDFPEFN